MPRFGWLRMATALGAVVLLATACPRETPAEAPVDEELVIGYILPETGPLAFLGPPQIRAVEMAIQEMEEAGGPLGLPIRLVPGDEAGDAAVASETANRLLAEGVHAVIGAAASGMSLAVIDQITAAGVVQCSASNTSPTFTAYDDGGFYFRTAPSDVLQGPVLGEVVLEDGNERVAILARGDDYGRGLADATQATLEEAGAEVVSSQVYDPEAVTFDAEASAVAGQNPDAVVVIPFEEGIQLIQSLIEVGIEPDQLYGADGIRSEELSGRIDPANPNVIDGFKGTGPDPAAVPGFLDRLREFDPELEETIFSPQAYDCANLIGLAVEAAGTTDPNVFKDHIIPLSRGETECSGFAECAEHIREGESIRYQFASGVIELTDAGEPVNGRYEVWEWLEGALESVESREISLGL